MDIVVNSLLVLSVVFLNFIVLKNIFRKSKAKSAFNKAVLSTMYTLGIVYLFYDYSFIAVLFISSLYILGSYYALTYGEMTYGSVASIFESNKDESKEFFRSINKIIVLKVLGMTFVYVVSHSVLAKKDIHINEYLSYFSFLISVVCTIGLYKVYTSDYRVKEVWTKPLRYNSILNAIYHVSEYFKYKRMLRKTQVSSQWRDVVAPAQTGKYYIVLIGESACRSRFHFYGYSQKNTPALADLNGYRVVEDPISPSAQTMTSIPRMFAINDIDSGVNFNLNIIDLANEAGFETYWISNQGELGLADTDITLLAKRAKHSTFLQKEYSNAGSDFALVNEVDKIVSSPSKNNRVIFLHTMGSHWDFSVRSASGLYEFSELTTQKDFYDNTIHNTYMLIEDLRKVFNEREFEYDLVYFSDHALVKTESYPYLNHGVGKLFSLEATEVPLVFVSETSQNSELIKGRYYMRDFVHTLSDWMGISAMQTAPEYSVLNPDRMAQENYIMDDGLRIVKLEGKCDG